LRKKGSFIKQGGSHVGWNAFGNIDASTRAQRYKGGKWHRPPRGKACLKFRGKMEKGEKRREGNLRRLQE